jgi:hypothetical protein
MSRYLIVAHDTATSPRLIERVQELARDELGVELVLLVPATPVAELRLARSASHDAESVARNQAQQAQHAFEAAGVPLADARVGVASPRDAIAEEMRRNPGYAGFVVSSLPEEQSRWLRMNLPGALEREYGLPVIRVELTPTMFEYWRRHSGWGRTV